MKIAVCAPQVPFVRGGAEIFADTLVDELRARGHETALVTSRSVLSRNEGASARRSLRIDDRRRQRRRSTSRGDEGPMSASATEQARGGDAPVRQATSRPTDLGQSAKNHRTGLAALVKHGPSRALRSACLLANSATSQRIERRPADCRGEPHPPQSFHIARGVRAIRPLGNGSIARRDHMLIEGGRSSRPARRDHAKGRTAAARGLAAAGAQRPGRVRRPRRRGDLASPTRAHRRLLAPVDEEMGGSVRGFISRKPVLTTTTRRTARDRERPSQRPRQRTEARRSRGAAGCATIATKPRRAGRRAHIAARVTWAAVSPYPRVKGLLQPSR